MCECCDYIEVRGGRPGDRRLTAEFERMWQRRARRLIERDGLLVQTVETDSPYGYTIGLAAIGHPELVLFGLDTDHLLGLLSEMGERVLAGRPVRDGDRLRFGDWEFVALHCPRPAELVSRANLFLGRGDHESVAALQLVYPDVHGVWPWEPGCQLPPRQQPMPGTHPSSA